jgi:site-specific recombinase XerD
MEESYLGIWEKGFRTFLRAEKNMKATTVRTRVYQVLAFLRECCKEFGDIDRMDVLRHKENLISRGLDNSTINKHIKSCQYMFEYLDKDWKPIPNLPYRVKVPEIPAESDVERLFRCCGLQK